MKLKVGIIGTGGIAENGHADGLKECEQTSFWSVLSRTKERAKEFSNKHSAEAPSPDFDSLDEFLADPELQAVIIATPDRLHAEQAIACANAGKHILLEKPMATDEASCKAILEACKKSNVKLGLSYRLRWHPGHREVVALAHEGKFGELRHVRVLWPNKAKDNSNWRAHEDVGRWWSLAAVGTHCLDFSRWVLCKSAGEIQKVHSITSNSVWNGPHDESALVVIKFSNGSTAEIHSSVLIDAPTRVEIYGSTGYAICEGTFGRKAGGKIWTNSGEIEFQRLNPFKLQIEDFANAVAENRSPEVNGEEAFINTKVLLQIAEQNGF